MDVVLLYDASADIAQVLKRARALREGGMSVMVLRQVPEGLRYRDLLDLGTNRGGQDA